jgi:hypothetical protein
MYIAPGLQKKFASGTSLYNDNQKQIISVFIKLIFPLFFMFHYSGFMVGHLFFILIVSSMPSILSHGGYIMDIATIKATALSLLLPLLFLFISHSISFFVNFIGKKEYKKTSTVELFIAPYPRIIIMHLTILFGALIMAITRIPSSIIALFVLLKIYFDVKAHNKEHQKLENRQLAAIR